MKDELKKQVIARWKDYGSWKIRQGDTATSLIKFIEEIKPLHNQLKEVDREFWISSIDNLVRYSLEELLSTLQDLSKNPATAALLTAQIQNQTHGTILNSFQVAFDELRKIEMTKDLQNHYNEQVILFQNMKKSLTQKTEASSGGCYIATMAYGDYDHPQVMELRLFRDNVLDKSVFGKWFIKTYYHYSPKLVEKLKNKKVINSIIRKSLNQFIKLIK